MTPVPFDFPQRLVVRLTGPLKPGVGFVVGGTGTGTARIGTGGAGRVADADPWGHTPPLAVGHLTTFWIFTHRSLALAAVLPALWVWQRSRRRWCPGSAACASTIFAALPSDARNLGRR